jgi:Na+/melibiose symporter-like transporter
MMRFTLPARSAKPVGGGFAISDHVFVSILWFALFSQWATVIPTIVPDQVRVILGPNGTNVQEVVSGIIIAASNVVALLVPPLAGAMSDRVRSPHGRRRPFLIVGMAGASIGLLLIVPFGTGSSLTLYALAILNLQLWWNWAAGPYAGLIADVVPRQDRAAASAWLNVMVIVGSAVGNALMAVFYVAGQPLRMVLIFIIVNSACLWITLARVHEAPGSGSGTGTFEFAHDIKSFFPSIRDNQNFYWVLLTRLLAQMGIWPIFFFFLYYLEKVVGVPTDAAPNLQNGLLLLGALVAIPAALLATRMIARYGMLNVVRTTSWIIAIAASCYAAIAFYPTLRLVVPALVLFSAGYGAYIAADWALALRVLPSSAGAGKDMGIWHVSMVLPQIIGSAVIGWMITRFAPLITARFAYALAFGLCALLLVSASLLVTRIRLPNEERQD